VKSAAAAAAAASASVSYVVTQSMSAGSQTCGKVKATSMRAGRQKR